MRERCWCGVGNPHYSDDLEDRCGGTGTLRCRCGGDFCVCHNHGEVDCDGCEDCDDEGLDDEALDDEYFDDEEAEEGHYLTRPRDDEEPIECDDDDDDGAPLFSPCFACASPSACANGGCWRFGASGGGSRA